MSIENPFSQLSQESQQEKLSPVLELKKKFEEQTGEKCPYTDEELSRFEKEGLVLGVITKEQQAEMDETEQRRKELFADFWKKEGVSPKDLKWKLTDGPKVEVGRFTDKGVEINPMSEEQIKALKESTGKTFEEQRRDIFWKNAEEILRLAKESGSWVKDWTPKEDAKFVEGWVKTMETLEEAAQEMPEQTPPARVTIGKWGSEPKLGWEWTNEDQNLGVSSSRKIE